MVAAAVLLWALPSGCGTPEGFGNRSPTPASEEQLEPLWLLHYQDKEGGEEEAHAAFLAIARSHEGFVAAWEGAAETVASADRDALRSELEARAAASEGAVAIALQVLALGLITELQTRERLLYELLEKDPDHDAWPRAGLGDVFRGRGNPRAALTAYKEAVRSDPQLARAWRGRAECRVELQQLDDAADAYERYLELRPSDPRALYNLGRILYQSRGRLRDARPYLERALAILPDDVDTLVTLAALCMEEEPPSPAEAETYLLHAENIEPEDPDVQLNLGVLYADHLDDTERAIHHFERNLELPGGGSARVKRWLEELRARRSRPR